jgi:hypothetical protein
MAWTKEQLNEIQNYGASLFDVEVIAICMQLDEAILINELLNKASEVYKAYYSGFYQTEANLRKVILKQALNGSSQAQSLFLKYKDTCEKTNKLKGIYGN